MFLSDWAKGQTAHNAPGFAPCSDWLSRKVLRDYHIGLRSGIAPLLEEIFADTAITSCKSIRWRWSFKACKTQRELAISSERGCGRKVLVPLFLLQEILILTGVAIFIRLCVIGKDSFCFFPAGQTCESPSCQKELSPRSDPVLLRMRGRRKRKLLRSSVTEEIPFDGGFEALLLESYKAEVSKIENL